MPIGKNKKCVQAYVLNETKAKIVKKAEENGKSESYIAGKILDKAFEDKK